MKRISLLLAVCAAPYLTGCAVVAHQMSAKETEIEVSLDGNALPATSKAILARSQTLVMATNDKVSLGAAQAFEKEGYQVRTEPSQSSVEEMAAADRRAALQKACKGGARADAALIGFVVSGQVTNGMVGQLMGRAKSVQKWELEVLDCRTGELGAISGVANLDVGVHQNIAEVTQKVASAVGAKVAAAVGPRTARTANATRAAPAPLPIAPAPVAATSTDAPAGSMSTMELQQRLGALGYKVGTADGVMGKRTVDALRSFQGTNKLAVTGTLDAATNAALRQKTPQFARF